MNLRPYQERMVDHVVEHPRCALMAGMGLGKTATVLTALDRLAFVEPVLPALVLAPLRVARSVWPTEARTWGTNVVASVTGSAAERERALAAPADIHATNYESLPWLVERLGDRWPYRTVVADESTRLKSFRTRQGGVRARALAGVAHRRVDRWVNLTGTPAPNGLADLWGQMWFLDQGERLGRTFTAFTDRWFRPHPSGFGLLPMPHAQAEIEARVGDLCMSLAARDQFALPELVRNVIEVELPPRARTLYRDMERSMFAELEAGAIEAFSAAGRTLKCLQLANGAAYVDERGERWEVVHDAKLEALREVIAEAAGAPVLVAYHFRSDLARLRAAFPQARELDAQAATIDAWNRGEIPVLLAHPASAGHGLNLQDGGNILVFFGLWWGLEEHQQIIERIGPTRQAQAGHDRPVFVHYLVARDTVDEIVLRRLETKASVQDLLMDAMRRKGYR